MTASKTTVSTFFTPLACLVLALLTVGCQTVRPPETVRRSGDHLFERGDYAAAAEEYGEIVARYPGDWRAQYKYGLSLLELEKNADARQALEIALTQKPDNEDIADALAEAMYRDGDEQRLFAFLRDRAQTRQTVHAWLRLGRYAADMSDPDSANRAIETAISLNNRQSPEPYLAAADLAERIGDLGLATRRLKQAYRIAPHDKRIAQRLEAMGEVPGPTLGAAGSR